MYTEDGMTNGGCLSMQTNLIVTLLNEINITMMITYKIRRDFLFFHIVRRESPCPKICNKSPKKSASSKTN